MARRSAPFARIALDYADHPKIAGLSDAAFRAHIEMILYARRYKTDGLIPKRIAKRFASAALSELLANDDDRASLTQDSDGDYWLHDFADWQETRAEIDAKSENNRTSGAKGAAKRWRNAKRVASGSDSETLPKTDSESIAETETETELEAKASSRPRKRATRLAEDWQPTADDIAWCKTEHPAVDGKRETEKFRNHWIAKSGKDATKLDWSRTWRNWIINSEQFGSRLKAVPNQPWTPPPGSPLSYVEM